MSKHPLYNTTGLQKNNKSHILYALADKQMELKQLQKEYGKKILKIKSDLSSLKNTICLFDDDCEETIAKISKRTSSRGVEKRNSYFDRGEAKKLILDVLRVSKEPLDTEVISLKIQDIKKIPKDDIILNKKIQKTVVLSLRKLEEARVINQVGKDGLSIIWDIKSLESVA